MLGGLLLPPSSASTSLCACAAESVLGHGLAVQCAAAIQLAPFAAVSASECMLLCALGKRDEVEDILCSCLLQKLEKPEGE